MGLRVAGTVTEAAAPGAAGSQPRGHTTAIRYLAKRLAFYLATAVFAVVLNFAIPRFMPGDPALEVEKSLQERTGTAPSPQVVASLRALYGDPTKNLAGQFFDYLNHLAHFNFGLSIYDYPVPVSNLVMQALPWTLLLVGATTILAWIIGTALGAWAGWRRGSRLDTLLTPATTFISALPAFWLSIVCLWFFAFKLHWFPSSGGYDPTVPYNFDNLWFLLSVLRYGALPAFTLVFIGFSGWMFSMRNVMVPTISEEYVQLARAKGLPNRTVLFRYAARNALLPNVTGLATAIGGVIGGVVLTEIVFTYPGMGYLLYQAIQYKDFPVMQLIFLMITIMVLVSNFIADSLYVWLDPRTREGI
jgi:peptide/nickel transport system permease protein